MTFLAAQAVLVVSSLASGLASGFIGGAGGEIILSKVVAKRKLGKASKFRWERVARTMASPGATAGLADGILSSAVLCLSSDGCPSVSSALLALFEQLGWAHTSIWYIVSSNLFFGVVLLPLSAYHHRQDMRRAVKAGTTATAWRCSFDLLHHLAPIFPFSMLGRWGAIALFHAMLIDVHGISATNGTATRTNAARDSASRFGRPVAATGGGLGSVTKGQSRTREEPYGLYAQPDPSYEPPYAGYDAPYGVPVRQFAEDDYAEEDYPRKPPRR